MARKFSPPRGGIARTGSAAITRPAHDDSNPDLVEIIRDEIENQGPITFARFMELAIYHPEHGYYATEAVRAGTEGDFITAPETDPIFGHTLARQIAECWELLGRPEQFSARESGSGRGTLARDILNGLRHESPDAFTATTYLLSDLNLQRQHEAVRRLEEDGFGDHVAGAGDEPITGVVLANELLDALPFHRLVYQGGDFRERYVIWSGEWFVDETGPLSDPQIADSVRGLALQEGQILEVSPAAQEWVAGLSGRLERGFAILIDYGYPAEELYGPERAEGTLRTYRQHLVGVDPYQHVGRQDITAHVDFSAMISAAKNAGLSEIGLTTQAFFFAGLGIEEILMEIQRTADDPYRYVNAREAVMHLIDPRGLGRFRVLVLGKDMAADTELRGLSFSIPEFPH